MHSYVIRAEDLILLNDVRLDDYHPTALQWINRGTNQKLQRTSIATLMRTLYQPADFSGSVQRLHASTGLRISFRTLEERNRFKLEIDELRSSI